MQGGLNVGMGPILLKATPDHYMGRVTSSLNLALYGSSLLTAVLAGWLGQFIPAYLLFLAGSVIVVLSGIFGWFAMPAPPKMEETTPQM
jgi:MFS family permease